MTLLSSIVGRRPNSWIAAGLLVASHASGQVDSCTLGPHPHSPLGKGTWAFFVEESADLPNLAVHQLPFLWRDPPRFSHGRVPHREPFLDETDEYVFLDRTGEYGGQFRANLQGVHVTRMLSSRFAKLPVQATNGEALLVEVLKRPKGLSRNGLSLYREDFGVLDQHGQFHPWTSVPVHLLEVEGASPYLVAGKFLLIKYEDLEDAEGNSVLQLGMMPIKSVEPFRKKAQSEAWRDEHGKQWLSQRLLRDRSGKPLRIHNAPVFERGWARIRTEGGWTILGENGRCRIPDYEDVRLFSSGDAPTPFKSGGYWRYYDVVAKPRVIDTPPGNQSGFDNATAFGAGVAAVEGPLGWHWIGETGRDEQGNKVYGSLGKITHSELGTVSKVSRIVEEPGRSDVGHGIVLGDEGVGIVRVQAGRIDWIDVHPGTFDKIKPFCGPYAFALRPTEEEHAVDVFTRAGKRITR